MDDLYYHFIAILCSDIDNAYYRGKNIYIYFTKKTYFRENFSTFVF